jgi:hypothetical protein
MKNRQISELLFAEVPILREAFGDFPMNCGVDHGFLSAYLPGHGILTAFLVARLRLRAA